METPVLLCFYLYFTPAFFSSRCFYYMLAALLHHSHPEDTLCQLLCASGNVQCLHVAGIREQCREPHHIHHFQCGVSQGVHEDPALLSAPFCMWVRSVPWLIFSGWEGRSRFVCFFWKDRIDIIDTEAFQLDSNECKSRGLFGGLELCSS